MRIESIRHWQWIVLSLVIGFAIGYLQQQVAGDLGSRFGSEISDQRTFEQSLVTTEQGKPRFTNLRVHSQDLPDANGTVKRFEIVSGLYFNGHYEQVNSKLVAAWVPAFYIAAEPFSPATDVLNRTDPKSAARLSASKPSVRDFLSALSLRGVHYTRAWWLGMGLWHWLIASFVILGVVFPLSINLLVFGSIRRPREEPGIDLSAVKPPESYAQKPALDDDDLRQIDALNAELEEQLGPGTSTTPTEVHAATAPVRALETNPVEALNPDADSDAVYGSKPDDFYPTARPAPHTKQ